MHSFTEVFRSFDPIPVGYRNGALVTGLRIDGRDPDSGELGHGIEAQLANAYENLRRAVEAAGGSTDNIGQVSFFLADFDDRAAINPPWVAMFPDENDRPTYKFMPAPLPEGELVQMEFYAVLGERRTDIHLTGVAHANPIPMAVRIGAYLFSSRVLAYDPATAQPAEGNEAQARFLYENVNAVIDAAGMSWSDVVQGRGFLADLAEEPLLGGPWAERFPDAAARPPLHLVRYGAGALRVMLEIVAEEGAGQ
ncbi:MAG TPA: RidA family protein [Acidimicrobiales bacterium]|nr:RidA family protein [Acidimicrobiales bacterium]